jgi:hypothetical protein
VKDFVQHLREHGIKPHIARIDGRKTPGLDGRTSCTEGYKVSQRKRKRVEEIFGWLKTVGGMRKTRFIGEARTQIAAYCRRRRTTCCELRNCSARSAA